MIAVRLRVALLSARSGTGTYCVQEGLDDEPDTDSHPGCQRGAQSYAEHDEHER
jgi:hypothetical protein